MTLSGLALAIGILVDDATVTIENINWHLENGKPVLRSILDGAAQIVTPAFVSLLCICIVFVPMFFLPGVAGFLFVPMALSVVFAMVMRSEEHTSELQSLMRISYAVFSLKKKTIFS